MNNALARIVEIKQGQSGRIGALTRGDDKVATTGHGRVVRAVRLGIDNMIHTAEHLLRVKHLTTIGLQAL
ncbi:hypothetical protein A3709_00010 [Halioglobus sp. HI00S01]|uniref:hypothetical protein n=1 Tax=Halioglobus sp. HI00S01 TaxID=1822214 RepID=UPI0007C3FE28|nr:hypothetical protein [Halioglobus sp. HI00S01]KZX60499.1 hypothetical protein A3709_00010 [Halioglobus sp. HI00S01]